MLAIGYLAAAFFCLSYIKWGILNPGVIMLLAVGAAVAIFLVVLLGMLVWAGIMECKRRCGEAWRGAADDGGRKALYEESRQRPINV